MRRDELATPIPMEVTSTPSCAPMQVNAVRAPLMFAGRPLLEASLYAARGAGKRRALVDQML